MKPLLVSLLLLLVTACGGSSSNGSSTTTTSTTTTTTTTTTATPEEGVCGTRGAPQCPEGQFCDFPAGSECGAADRGGRCAPRPQACTREFNPVCGCDGQTHPTACVANSNGVAVEHPGQCDE